VIGNSIRLVDMEFIFMQTVLSMKENGKPISSMARARKLGQTVASTSDTTSTPRNKAKVYMCGQIAINILENGSIMPFKDLVSISGTMEESTAESGKTI
jgi:hypothetical protein